MKAVVANSRKLGAVDICEVEEPTPGSNEVVISVTAFSLNRGELRRAEMAQIGTQIGWDLVGQVIAEARDGSGPSEGDRVVGFSRRMQGWAERVALPIRDCAVIPDEVSDKDAATLPVAGLTALYSLERCGRLLGSRVLITGASGGVGYFACQLAKLMGADVTAHLRRNDFEYIVSDAGIDKVFVSADGSGLPEGERFRAIIDGVGGAMLEKFILQLDEGGRAILYGVSDGRETTLAVRELMLTGDGRVEGFHLYRESEIESATKGLGRLLKLLADKKLTTLIEVDSDWQNIGKTASSLIARNFAGKAVQTI